jgi:hypothetical protein
MQLSMLVVGCVLIGQVPGDAPLRSDAWLPPPAVLPSLAEPEPAAAKAAAPQTDPDGVVVDEAVKTEPEGPGKTRPENLPANASPADPQAGTPPPRRHRLTPPEMVAEALVLPPGSRLTGRPLSLLAALSSTSDRRQQLEVTHAYWRPDEAVAVDHFSLDYAGRLEGLGAGERPGPLLRAARASAAALLREAEVAAVSAQHELAALMLLPPDAPLPLPADPPHIGPYRTQFDQLFSTRIPPPRIRLIDRTLPILYRAVDGRASAVQAAEDALMAAIDAYPSGRVDLPAVLRSLEEYLRERRALIRSVCRYNHEIADYAVAVVGPGSSPQVLVGMLINPTPQAAHPILSGSDARVEPAEYTQRVPTPARWPGQRVPTPAKRPGLKEPTPARRPGQKVPPPASSQPMLPAPAKEVPAPATQWSPSEPPGNDRPPAAGLPKKPDSPEAVPPERPSVPVEPTPVEPTPTTANKPVADGRDSVFAPALYPALVDVPPAAQAKQLTLTLHWDRDLPQGIGPPVSLEECLKNQSGGKRAELIGTYWVVRQRAAEYQVLAQQTQMLDVLLIAPRGDEKDPSGLRLRSARLSSEAALIEGHAALVEAQFELATRLGRESDALWPIAGSTPRCDRYPLGGNGRPGHVIPSWPVRRLAAMIPGLGESVERRATAVIEADAARAAAASSAAGGRPIEPLLACISGQTEQTLAFLAALTDYNRAIAEYTLAVLPPETPSDKLVAVLVAAG